MFRLVLFVVFYIPTFWVGGQDLTGKWVGYLDQSVAADTIKGYEAYWEEGIWKKGEFTHDLNLTLFQEGIIVKGVYHISTKGDTDHFGKFMIDGSFGGTALHYMTILLIEQTKNALGVTFCFNSAELFYSKRDGYEYLEGDWEGWNQQRSPCAPARIMLKKVENTDPAISNLDISGVWKGYEDQTDAALKMSLYEVYWDSGRWKKGEPTGIVEVKLNQKGKMVTGEYDVYNSGDSTSYAIYKIKGWIEDSVLSVMSFEVDEHAYRACAFWTSLKYSFKEGIEYLKGDAVEDADGYLCAAAVIFLGRDRKIPQTEDLLNSKQEADTVNLVAGAKITLHKVQFNQSSYSMREDAIPQLNQLVSWMNKYPDMVIQLEGHTDNQGVAKRNMKLSEDRVNVIKEYLVNNGIKSKRIKVKAFGQTKPIASNKNPETRKLNRRVEMVVLKK